MFFFLQRGNNNKNVKIGWGLLKIFRSPDPILTRLGTNHPFLEGYEWDCPSQRGGNNKRVKIH
jgi:hypothetical protein